MPNRIIKESIHESERLSKLTDFQFRLWVNLITYVDDYGRGDARPAIIKGKCFPLRERLTNADIDAALRSLAGVGCVDLYEVDGKPYLYFPRWESHQNIRNKKSKFPAPADCGNPKTLECNCEQLKSIDCNCEQLRAIDCNCSRNPIQSESEYESEIEANASCAEPQSVSTPPVIVFPLNDGSEYPVPDTDYREWVDLYPSVDVNQQLRNMKGWLLSNPGKRKTKRGINRFITNWLSREQNKGGATFQTAKPVAKPQEIYPEADKDSKPYKLAVYLHSKLYERSDAYRDQSDMSAEATENKLNGWAGVFEKMLIEDAISYDAQMNALVYSQISKTSDVWRKSIITAEKFREKFNTIDMQMRVDIDEGNYEKPGASRG